MPDHVAPAAGVFISYRRQDSAPYARLVREELRRELGDGRVFMDVDSLDVGADFEDAIQRAISTCAVLLALIGPDWLAVTGTGGRRRLDDPHDTVRREIEAALRRDIVVIPVLIDGAAMPRDEQLPSTLAPLTRRNAVELSYNRYDYDLGRLQEAVEDVLGRPHPVAVAPPARPPRGRRRTITGIGVVLLVAGIVLAAGWLPPWLRAHGLLACDVSRGELMIGVITPMSGALEALGPGVRDSVELAVREANARCAVPGYQLSVRVVDDGATPDGADAATRTLLADDRLVGVVGSLLSSNSAAIQDALAGSSVVQISAATRPDLTRSETGRRSAEFFRIAGTDDAMGAVAAEHLVQVEGRRSVAVLDDGTPYGTGIARDFARRARQLGATVLGEEHVDSARRDYSDVADRVGRLHPDAVFYGGEYPSAGLLSGQLAAAGVTGPLVGGDGIVDPAYIDLGGRDGDIATYVGALPEHLPGYRGFIESYQRHGYGSDPNRYGPFSYDATAVLVTALAAVLADRPWDPAVRPSLVHAVARTDTTGMTGPIRFDNFGDLVESRVGVYQVQRGAWIPVRTVVRTG